MNVYTPTPIVETPIYRVSPLPEQGGENLINPGNGVNLNA